MVQEERNLFAPHYAGYLGSNLDEAKKLQDKVVKFGPTCKVSETTYRKCCYFTKEVIPIAMVEVLPFFHNLSLRSDSIHYHPDHVY